MKASVLNPEEKIWVILEEALEVKITNVFLVNQPLKFVDFLAKKELLTGYDIGPEGVLARFGIAFQPFYSNAIQQVKGSEAEARC